MLLEFKTKNYKCFKDEAIFSMTPAPKQKGLDYSLLSQTAGKKNYTALCSSVVYGANAAGKSNIVSAVQTFKSIIIHGNINNVPGNFPNAAENTLELIPNNSLSIDKPEPVYFSIKFIDSDLLFDYSLVIDLGSFLDSDYHRSIKSESLAINEKELFIRTDNKLEIFEKNLKSIEQFLVPDYKKNFNLILSYSEKSLRDTDLYITNGFKTMISSEVSSMFYDFFMSKLKTYYQTFAVNMYPTYMNKYYEDTLLNEAAKNFGINSNKLVYVRPDNSIEQQPVLCSVMKDGRLVQAINFESYGTYRFINILPMFAQVLRKGGTIVMDEFDTSLHPMVVMDIINIFHNDEINKNHAQLIFNTQNPIFLNNNLFRRDEIKFVERSDETNCSELYSLSDFGTKGTNARKGKDYMNNYFMSKYGAIRDIDLSDIFKKFVEYGDAPITK
ncbi:MAG: ATP-binding protein [Treponema sp.]|nr:ATP-binding protein [Treponema sp.]